MFDGACLWSFGNEFDKNIVFFGVDNSSSRHSENLKKFFLVLGGRTLADITDSAVEPNNKN